MNDKIKKTKINLTFGNNIKRFRRIRGLSQYELADITGLAQNFISAIESGKKWISPETLEILTKALNVKPFQLFILEEDLKTFGQDSFSFDVVDFSTSIFNFVTDYCYQYGPGIKKQDLDLNDKKEG